jgi:DNA repair ATPase RecN
MQKATLMAATFLTMCLSTTVLADERPEHFEGKPADTLDQAVANFSEANGKLAAILEEEDLGPEELHEVHQLTYTLENALEKIREDLDELAEVLEEIHIASETIDTETVKARGEDYLEAARKVVK